MPINKFVVRIESYDGDDTFLRCGDGKQDFLFAIAALNGIGGLEIMDQGYRSEVEALKAWPDAKPLFVEKA
jgi:hypothetical protein